MARLICLALSSLDGSIEDTGGRFDWAASDDELHSYVNDLELRSALIFTDAGWLRR